MKTGVREFNGQHRLPRAQEFARLKATQGYNVGADKVRDDDPAKVVWKVFWSPGFLDLENLVSA
jgi:hypothetical protein